MTTTTPDWAECSKCGERKSVSEFPRRSNRPSGHTSHCRTCHSKLCAERRKRLDVRLREREMHREWYYEKGGKPKTQEKTRRWRAKTGYPGWSDETKQAARQITASAIRSGHLKRQPCEVCGATKSHAHHDDYSKPLSVRWLCARHHTDVHFPAPAA